MRTIFLFTPLIFFIFIKTSLAFEEPFITEIMANPEGSDQNKEWIEVYNPNNSEISLENFIIQNTKTKTKLEKIIIPKKSFYILSNNELKFSIKNTGEKITLLSPSNKTISEISINKSESEKSLSLSTIYGKNSKKNLWIESIESKGKENASFYEIEGEISKELIIAENIQIEIDSKKILIPESFDIETLAAFTKKGDKIKALIKKEGSVLSLEKIKLNQNIKTEKKIFPIYILLIPITIISFFLIIAKDQGFASYCK